MTAERLPVLLLLGPSGVGKSTVGRWIAEDLRFRHIELDLWPKDGIDAANLRAEWEAFWSRADAGQFDAGVRAQISSENAAGAVLTFPSLVVFSAEQIAASERSAMNIIALYGTEADCLGAFLRLYQHSGRRLDRHHWLQNNAASHNQLGDACYSALRLRAFQGGQFRERAIIMAEVRRRLH